MWAVGPSALPCAGGFPPQRPPEKTRPASGALVPGHFPLSLAVLAALRGQKKCSSRPSASSADKKGVKVFFLPLRVDQKVFSVPLRVLVTKKVLRCSSCPSVSSVDQKVFFACPCGQKSVFAPPSSADKKGVKVFFLPLRVLRWPLRVLRGPKKVFHQVTSIAGTFVRVRT